MLSLHCSYHDNPLNHSLHVIFIFWVWSNIFLNLFYILKTNVSTFDRVSMFCLDCAYAGFTASPSSFLMLSLSGSTRCFKARLEILLLVWDQLSSKVLSLFPLWQMHSQAWPSLRLHWGMRWFRKPQVYWFLCLWWLFGLAVWKQTVVRW